MGNALITGASGFIGSNFIHYLLDHDKIDGSSKVINLDNLSYSGRGENLKHVGLDSDPRYVFVFGDISRPDIVNYVFERFSPEIVFNFAAESHVDRSIEDDTPFVKTNILGPHTLMEASLKHGIKKFVQVSTDEVYGSLKQDSPSSTEESLLIPRSPYSATKASADFLTLSYFHTHNLPMNITRSSNNFGRYQFPEKLLPLFITNLIDGKKVPLMWSEKNPGENVRDWLHVDENCRAIWYVSQHGVNGEIYNISGENEKTNFEMTKMLLNEFGLNENMIEKIPHRKGHDFRYSIDMSKLKKLGFKPNNTNLESKISELCEWYTQNENWWRPLKK